MRPSPFRPAVGGSKSNSEIPVAALPSLPKTPPRNPLPFDEIVPLLVTVPVARNTTMPPEVPSQGLATIEPAALMVAEVYSGTFMAWAPGEEYAYFKVPEKVNLVDVSPVILANSHRPTGWLVKSVAVVAVEVFSVADCAVCHTMTRSPDANPVELLMFTKFCPAGALAVIPE
jgi:hypothetical protein